jgi:hypothetical protein
MKKSFKDEFKNDIRALKFIVRFLGEINNINHLKKKQKNGFR